MTKDALNLALALAFEPKPTEASGKEITCGFSPLRMWQINHLAANPAHWKWRPRDFTEPELVLMCLKWLISPKDFTRSVELFTDSVVVAFYDDPADYEGARLVRTEGPLELAILEATAKARGVWVED